MTCVAQSGPAVSPSLTAGLLLAAVGYLRDLGLPHPSATQILETTGASRSRAYELRETIQQALGNLLRPVGRPPTPPPAETPTSESEGLSRRVLLFLLDHPGAAGGGGGRKLYGDAFRRFVLELRQRHPELDLEAFADAVCVPLGTLKEWLRPATAAPQQTQPETSAPPMANEATDARIQTVLDAWAHWSGPSFVAFCDHVQKHLRIPWGRTYLATLLQAYGTRIPVRRRGRSPDERALRDAFVTFFPGAQWVGDGTALTIELGGEQFTFNLELCVDAASDAAVGASLQDAEDSQAVTEAFSDAVQTTGAPPLALLLDNRPSNHTQEVDQTLADTLRIRATLGRAQNKAHVEGAFGLFQQVAPPLHVEGSTPKELARSILRLVVQTWGRVLNHRPRRDRGGRSRAEIYQAVSPSPEEVAHAKAALQKRHRQQELAHQTRQARLDPLVRDTLEAAFDRLHLLDPQGHVRAAIARYPLDAVLAGIATFEGKHSAGSLPPNADARYLLGIVRNISEEEEGWAISLALLEARLQARDRALSQLQYEQQRLARVVADPLQHLCDVVDRALATDRLLDRFFWLRVAADLIRAAPDERSNDLFRLAARRAHATHRVPYKQRLAAVRFLAQHAIPVA